MITKSAVSDHEPMQAADTRAPENKACHTARNILNLALSKACLNGHGWSVTP